MSVPEKSVEVKTDKSWIAATNQFGYVKMSGKEHGKRHSSGVFPRHQKHNNISAT
jgi:hypothetical protein